ncbi:MAG: oligosaccharyl transferase, archaeosortase A system-associated [Candidatus Methanoperedens sp.]|nr:oligosaccharyl transferase, archaeosortase A system-associated [Candidatus Methanoperedens sp.]
MPISIIFINRDIHYNPVLRCTLAKVKSNKNYKGKPEKKKTEPDGKSGYKGNIPIKYVSYVLLTAIFLFSFYIRGIIPINATFNNGVATGFAIDDAVFHMRLVENTINFFPHRIFYDAFTLYPRGNQLHWGPLFDQMIAFFALVGGLFINGGMPSQTVIDTVGAFFPAVLGALIVFPVYFIGKELSGEKAGLIGAFLISILPGQFLNRTTLGFTDNHAAEVFFLIITIMFFVMAVKRSENVTFDHLRNRDWAALKKPLAYSVLAGIFFGAYMLSWTSGVFFAVVIGIFFIIQYIIDYSRGKSTVYLGFVGIVAYVIVTIMVLPYIQLDYGFNPMFYSMLHPVVFGGFAVFFAFLTLASKEISKRELSVYHYSLFVAAASLVILIAMKILTPDLYGATVGNWEFIFTPHVGGTATIAEAMPYMRNFLNFYSGIGYYLVYIGIPIGDYSGYILNDIFGNYGYNFYIAYIAIIVLCYNIIKKPRAEYTLITVWSVFILAILLAQDRFAYYYSINVAILSGFLVSKVLDMAGWKNFNSNNVSESAKKIEVQHVLSLIILIAVVGFLPFGESPFNMSMQYTTVGSLSPGFFEWHDALTWMRYNTPDPGLDYYAIYQKPKNGSTYPYPETAYGVMSWWDYGHVITYWGRRIPNANPFQAGIGGGSGGQHLPGASTFLIAQTENEANKVLDELGINRKPGARYVVSDAYMAYSIMSIFGDWDNTGEDYYVPAQISGRTVAIPSPKYMNTMEAKLHIFDGNGLKTYRLVHESNVNNQIRGGNVEVGLANDGNGKPTAVCANNYYCTGKYWYNQFYGGNLPLEYSGFVKIFEHVKGAVITGRAPSNTTVTLSNTIKTNIGRDIQYSQTTTSDGTYSFTVPYSTLGPISESGYTRFDTKPQGAYNVTAGNVSKQIDVGERDVMEGNTVRLDLV